MKKIAAALLLSLLIAASSISAFAASPDVSEKANFRTHAALTQHMTAHSKVFEKTFTVGPRGGNVEIGFVTVSFPRNFLPASDLPRTFTAKVFAENGKGVIEFLPDTVSFLAPVTIRVHAYKGLLYDESVGRNVLVSYRAQTFKATHFSRYCWQ